MKYVVNWKIRENLKETEDGKALSSNIFFIREMNRVYCFMIFSQY